MTVALANNTLLAYLVNIIATSFDSLVYYLYIYIYIKYSILKSLNQPRKYNLRDIVMLLER